MTTCTKTKYVDEKTAMLEVERIRKKSDRTTNTTACILLLLLHTLAPHSSRNVHLEEIAELRKQVIALTTDNGKLQRMVGAMGKIKIDNENLKNDLRQLKSKWGREINTKVNADSRIQSMESHIAHKNKEIKRLKLDFNELFTKYLQATKEKPTK